MFAVVEGSKEDVAPLRQPEFGTRETLVAIMAWADDGNPLAMDLNDFEITEEAPPVQY